LTVKRRESPGWRAVLAVALLLALAGCGSDRPEKYPQEGLAAFQQQ